MKRDGGPAFPTADNDAMTLRDYFAGQALVGIATPIEGDACAVDWDWDNLAKAAYMAADAMLAERERE